MKKFILVSIFVLALVNIGFAAGPDIVKHATCAYCGMDRAKYAHSRVLIEYDDGTSFGACSLRCAAVDLANNIDKSPKSIGVGDYNSKNLIDAERAFWVIGGKNPGVMTPNAKWAFEHKHAADKFINENGGVPAVFDDAIKAAYEDMYKDTKQIRERRKLKRSVKQKMESK